MSRPHPDRVITVVTHTSRPGGAELALRRYLLATTLPVRLVTLEPGELWEGLPQEVRVVRGLTGLRRGVADANLVVANTMRSALMVALAAPRRTPLAYWVRDGLTDSAMSRVALTLTRQVTARRVSHYIANSGWTAGTITAALGVPDDRVEVAYSMSGISDDGVDRARRSLPPGPLRLLFLGRLSPWKAPHVAVEAVQRLRALGVEATLTIAGGAHFGEDAYLAELRSRVAAEPAASLVGHVDDVAPLLAAHDILVHCSTTPEPFGQVVVQGLAAGLSVLATDAGGPREVLAGAPFDLLTRPGDAEDLARRVADLLSRYPEVSSWAAGRGRDFADGPLVSMSDDVLTRVLQATSATTKRIGAR